MTLVHQYFNYTDRNTLELVVKKILRSVSVNCDRTQTEQKLGLDTAFDVRKEELLDFLWKKPEDAHKDLLLPMEFRKIYLQLNKDYKGELRFCNLYIEHCSTLKTEFSQKLASLNKNEVIGHFLEFSFPSYLGLKMVLYDSSILESIVGFSGFHKSEAVVSVNLSGIPGAAANAISLLFEKIIDFELKSSQSYKI